MPLHARFRALTRSCGPRLRDGSRPRWWSVGGARRRRSPGSPPPAHPVDHPDPEAYRALALEVTKNTNRIAQMGPQIDTATARITELEGQIATTQQQLDATRAEIARLRAVVRARAAFIYTHAQAPQLILDIPHIEDIASGKQYAESATISDANKITDLTHTAAATDSHLRDLQATRDDQVQQRDTLQGMRNVLVTVTLAEKKLLDDAGTITVMGDSELTGDQIESWFAARGVATS